ncbi:MAG: DUF6265 family protein [Chitinophagaceae bacterium]
MKLLLVLMLFFNLPPSNFHLRQDDLIFHKLTGTWQRSNGRTHEKWEKKPDGSFFSVMYNVRGADTTIQEEVTTTLEGNRWVYAVKGAGNAEIVRFPSVVVTPTKAHFANPAHDFPTDIVYELIDPTKLRAYIVGPNDKGGKDTVWFNFTRIKD